MDTYNAIKYRRVEWIKCFKDQLKYPVNLLLDKRCAGFFFVFYFCRTAQESVHTKTVCDLLVDIHYVR